MQTNQKPLTSHGIKVIIKTILYFDERNMYNAKNCDLDLSVEWFELLFRNVKLTIVGVAQTS